MPLDKQVKSSRQRERGIDRLLSLLAFLHAHGRPLRVAELAKALEAPRSTVYELVRSLTEAGLLEVAGDEVFFGKLMYLYGTSYLRTNDLMRRGSSEVDRLSQTTGETCELCVLQGNRQAIIHMHPGARPHRISSDVGAQIPLPWTASARLLLSHLLPDDITALIDEEDLVMPGGKRLSISSFIADCQKARDLPVVVTEGLINSLTQCLAAPIYSADGPVEATICIVLPIDVTPAYRDTMEKELVASAERLSVR